MNPSQFTPFYPRDKTKTLFQPHSAPSFSPQINFTTSTGSSFFPSSTSPSFISHQGQTLKTQGQHGITLQSQKYKSYYTEYQDYRSSSASMIDLQSNGQKGYFTQNKERNNNVTGTEPQARNGFYAREPYKRQTQRSQERKRLYTTNDNYNNGMQDGFTSNSMIFLNKPEYVSPKNSSIVNYANNKNTSLTNTFSSRPSHISRQKQQKQPINPNLSKFINPSSRTQSNFNSRQKKVDIKKQLSNKSQYLQKANKKISLKRDIVGGKLQQEGSVHSESKPPLYPGSFSGEKSSVESHLSPNHRSISLMLQKEQSEISTVPVTSEAMLGNSKPFFSSVVSENSRQKEMFGNEGLDALDFRSRVESVEELRDTEKGDNPREKKQDESSKEKGFSKKNRKIATTYQATVLSTKSGSRGSRQLLQSKQSDKLPLSKQQSYSQTSSYKPAQTLQPQPLDTIRLSRIQSSTLSLQQKLLQLTLSLQTLTQHSKDHQTQIQQITSTLSKQQQQGISGQDIRRIKKQLKIMKTNFQTAFTSMTQQLNRKLVKEENIMKNFSQEIRRVMEGSSVLQKKIEQVEKGFSGFVKENEERMESLVLNQSFSSNKRSKNNSFEYGLELKNLSNFQDGSGAKVGLGSSFNSEQLGRKIENLQREIKKMKVFHIEQQESYYKQLEQVRSEIQALENGDKLSKAEQLGRQISTLSEEVSQLKRQGVNDGDKQAQFMGRIRQEISNQVGRMREQLNGQIASVSFELDETRKNVNSQLYQFRMNKLNAPTIPHPTLALSSPLTPQLQQKISQLNTKQRQFLITLTQYQQKLIQSEERTHGVYRSVQQLRSLLKDTQARLGKEIEAGVGKVGERCERMVGGVRQEAEDVKRRGDSGVEGKVRVLEERVAEVESRVEREIRVNEIQTENIESINAEFQRVINREIIPKFAQIHHTNLQTSHAIQLINNQLLHIKQNLKPSAYSTSLNVSPLLISPQLQTKIQTLCQSAIQKLLPSPIKILSTKDLPPSSSIPRLLSNQTQHQPQKNQTYLIDQNGYLMDWQGCYLMEVDEKGTRRKVKLTQEEIYFVEVNGIEVIRGIGVV